MKANYFKGVEEYEKGIISAMCEAIESGAVTIVATAKGWKMCVPSGGAVLDYTYNLVRWGFAQAVRGGDGMTAKTHKYCPYQDFAGTLAHFINTATEMGLYTRTTSEKFDGGRSVSVIWL